MKIFNKQINLPWERQAAADAAAPAIGAGGAAGAPPARQNNAAAAGVRPPRNTLQQSPQLDYAHEQNIYGDQAKRAAILAEKSRVGWTDAQGGLGRLNHAFQSVLGTRTSQDKMRTFIEFMADTSAPGSTGTDLGNGWTRHRRPVGSAHASLDVRIASGKIVDARGPSQFPPPSLSLNLDLPKLKFAVPKIDLDALKRQLDRKAAAESAVAATQVPNDPQVGSSKGVLGDNTPTITVSAGNGTGIVRKKGKKPDLTIVTPDLLTTKVRPKLALLTAPTITKPEANPIPVKLPADLAGKVLGLGEELGHGDNGKVHAIVVDGKPCPDYVAKTTMARDLLPVLGVEEGPADRLRAEIAINDELAALVKEGKLPNIIASAGTAEIGGKTYMIVPRIDGGTLSDHVDDLYDAVVKGGMAAGEFVDALARLVRGPMEGIAAMHDHGIVMNDLNCGSLLFEKAKDRAVVIDFGMAGHAGDAGSPSTIGSTAPEHLTRSESPVEPPRSPSLGGFLSPPLKSASSIASGDSKGSKASVLAPSGDSYAFGAVLYHLIHHAFPNWVDVGKNVSTGDAKMFELMAGREEFEERGTIFLEGKPPLDADLRAPEHRDTELALRAELDKRGYYSLIERLMRPEADKRSTLREELETCPLFQDRRAEEPSTSTALFEAT